MQEKSGFMLIHGFIQSMRSGDKTSIDEMYLLGMSGAYRPKPGYGRNKEDAMMSNARELLGGYSLDWKGADPAHSILINHHNGVFTRK